MKPWYETQFKLEEILEKLLSAESKEEEIENVGKFVTVNILLCKDIGLLQDDETSEIIWNSVSQEFSELLIDLYAFLKEKNIQ